MPFASRRAFLCAAAAALALPAHAADGPAAQLIEKVAAEVIELIQTTQGAQREAGIRAVLERYFDLPYMGRAALATHWEATTPEQRGRFLKAAISAEARAYSERFGQYGGQTLAVTNVSNRPNGSSVVASKLNQSNGQPIAIQWEVRDSGQGLRITDVKIEGVSMVMTRRSDFNSYIQNNGGKVDALIGELEKRASR
ncbi:MAG: ABC transporter substrate-binding protein [Reyranella sp.]|uniref:MlaC/ttg2D family ABC transporter substrate-binding protein n=1 Tax=Reyranella sp. TaxID=1929291 RepID=UPI001AC6E177|nr:ABC transporter substrate-binding protein [Reyranella sp.]MBN9090015.1 ABC transporter substrate-binding protein [Reyranella sp.]